MRAWATAERRDAGKAVRGGTSPRPTLHQLPAEYRRMAHSVRENAAAEQAARAYERCAAIAETALRGHWEEALSLEEAELESGYSRSHLRRLIREGIIPDAGGPGRPRILRRHLPRKPGAAAARSPDPGAPSVRQLARTIAAGG